MIIAPPPGLGVDITAAGPQPRWLAGYNVRFRLGRVETLGLMAALQGTTGAQIDLPGSASYRTIFNTPSPTTGQILAASTAELRLLQFDPGSSTPGASPRFAVFDIAPTSLASISDTLTDPNPGRIEIPPVWWFSDQDDLVVGCRSNGASEPCYSWDRNSAHRFAALANSPTGAVGGGIVNRILVLLGCSSVGSAQRFMTIRWSDRFNFTDWTPTDVNVSGELQLEGGSRIVGGGSCAYGIVAWTDKRMAILTESGNPSNVFNRTYVDGSRGMLSNKAWTEADAVLWWLDETRNLNAFDGGRPRTIENPMKAFLERLTDKEAARLYLAPNPEYSEVLVWFPSGADSSECDMCLVYNYSGAGAWSLWQVQRSAWCSRFGTIPALGISSDGKVFRHDLDVSMPDNWLNPLGMLSLGTAPETSTPAAADVIAFSFAIATNLITGSDVSQQGWQSRRLMFDHIPAPAIGAEGDLVTVSVISFNEPTLTATKATDARAFTQGQASADYRVSGKALMLKIAGTAQKTLWRFGNFDLAASGAGER